jgi:hypothetical protein
MKRYKLIKEYPGSPVLNTIVEKFKESSSSFYQIENSSTVVINNHVEDNPEYWEEVANVYYLVFTKEETSFKCWEPYIASAYSYDRNYVKYFTSLNVAEEYILLNKPDISIKYLEDYYEFKMVELRKKIKNERAQDK